MSKEVIKAELNLPSTDVLNFSQDAGLGIEQADKDSFAIPFLAILQGLSPQMETVEGAKIGHYINTITNEVSPAVEVVPVAFQRRYLEWVPRDQGGGFRGAHDVASVETDKSVRKDSDPNSKTYGQLLTAEGNLLKDTRVHYVLVVKEDGSFSPAIISISSTQIKKSKRLLALIQSIQLKDANGKVYNPPSFSHVYTLRSVKESNDSGSWYGFDITLKGQVKNAEVYNAAKAFHAQIVAGEVQVQHQQDADQEKF